MHHPVKKAVLKPGKEVSLLRKHNLIKATAYPTDEIAIFQAAQTFLQTEGWLIAPESSYAVRTGIDEALKAAGVA